MKKYIALCFLFISIIIIGNGCISTMMVTGLGKETRKKQEEGGYMCGQPLAVGMLSDFYIAYPIARHNDNNWKKSALIGVEVMLADVLIGGGIYRLFYYKPHPKEEPVPNLGDKIPGIPH